MNGIATGYIHTDIHYCPYCGERLTIINIWDDTVCDSCGKRFCVIEGESEETE